MIRGSAIKALNGEHGETADGAILKLYEALDTYVPLPERPIDQPFLMPIEDVFSISGRGTVVTGRIERGKIKVGEEVEIVGLKDTQKSIVTGVEMFRKLLDEGVAGDNVGCLLRGIDKEAVERGQVLCKPGSVKPHKKFMAEAYILTKEEGGRHTPFFNNYRPQFYFRTTDVTGHCTLPEGTEMIMPGDNRDGPGRTGGADRDGREAPLRHPRRRQNRRRWRRRKNSDVVEKDARAALAVGEKYAGPKHPYTAQSLRPPHSRQLHQGDREYGQAHGRAGAGTNSLADAHRTLHGQPLAPCG